MDILDHYLDLKDPCHSFPCHLCSEDHKKFIRDIVETSYLNMKGENRLFSELIGYDEHLINYPEVPRPDIGKFISKLLININFDDNYTLQRIGFDGTKFKDEKFLLFLYLIFIIAEDSYFNQGLIYKFNLKGFKVEDVLSIWCSKYMNNNQNAVFLSLINFFEYGSDHFIKLTPKARARFLERAIHNTNINSDHDKHIFLNKLKPIEIDTRGIKDLYQNISNTI